MAWASLGGPQPPRPGAQAQGPSKPVLSSGRGNKESCQVPLEQSPKSLCECDVPPTVLLFRPDGGASIGDWGCEQHTPGTPHVASGPQSPPWRVECSIYTKPLCPSSDSVVLSAAQKHQCGGAFSQEKRTVGSRNREELSGNANLLFPTGPPRVSAQCLKNSQMRVVASCVN